MNTSLNSNIRFLSKIFNVDLTTFIGSELTNENLVEYYPIVQEIIESLKRKENDSENQLTKSCDKILSICTSVLYKQMENPVLLKYFKDCVPYCSRDMFNKLNDIFLVNLIKLAQSKDEIHLMINIPSCLNALVDQHQSPIENFSQQQINLLDNFFRVMSKHPNFYHLDLVYIQFYIDLSLNIIYDLTGNSAVCKTCINILSSTCLSSEAFKRVVLEKSFQKLKETKLLNEKNISKKKLEMYVQDANLSLMTSLADFLLPTTSFQGNNGSQTELDYLRLTEYWDLIQSGLTHTNPLTRKRALYLLKRTTDLASLKKIDMKSTYADVYANNHQVHLYDAASSLWNDYFLCLEILEESSAHIVKPCLTTAQSLIEAVKSHKFHYSWLLVLFNRAFQHDSRQIIRWAVRSFLKADFHLLTTGTNQITKTLNQFIFGTLFLVLQKVLVFQKAEDNQYINYCPPIALQLQTFLSAYVDTMSSDELRTQFLEELTSTIYSFQWNPTSLIYVSNVFPTVASKIKISDVTYKNLSKIMLWTTSTFDVIFRSSIQTIIVTSLIKNIQFDSFNDTVLSNFTNTINVASAKECLSYKNSTWNALTEVFRSLAEACPDNISTIRSNLDSEMSLFLDETQSSEYTIQNSCAKFAKLILIYADISREEIYSKSVLTLIDKLLNCNKYVYASGERVDKCLAIFVNMLSYITDSQFIDTKSNSYKVAANIYNQTFGEILDYILRKSNDISIDFNKLNVYIGVLHTLFKFRNESDEFKAGNLETRFKNKVLKNFLDQLVSTILNSASRDCTFASEWKKFCAINLMSCVLESFECQTAYASFVGEQLLVKQLLQIEILSKAELVNLPRDLPATVASSLLDNYSIYNGQYHTRLWFIYDFILGGYDSQKPADVSSNDFTLLINKYRDSIELTTPQCITQLISCSKNFFRASDAENQQIVVAILNSIFDYLWDMRNDAKNFNEAYAQYLEVLFAPCVLVNDTNGIFKQFLLDICETLLDRKEEKPGMSKPLVNKALKMLSRTSSEFNESFVDILISFLTFGDMDKNKKLVKDTEIYIESLGETFGANQLFKADYLQDAFIRVSAVNYILASKNLEEGFFNKLIDSLMKRERELNTPKLKPSINSVVHRERFRLLQTLLSILPKLTEANYTQVLDYCETILLCENQPSIRAITEWLFIRTVVFVGLDKFAVDRLWSKLDEMSFYKVGYTFSWLNILFHLVTFLTEEKKVDFFIRLMPFILSNILSCNFQVRTYVEAMLIRIYKLMSEPYLESKTGLNDPKFLQNAAIKNIRTQIYTIIKPAFESEERHASKMIKQFTFQFHATNDYSLETIYSILPGLYGVQEEEQIQIDTFLSIVLDKQLFEIQSFDYELDIGLPIRLKNIDTKLMTFSSGQWQFATFRDEPDQTGVEDIQKKIIPWENLMPSETDMEDLAHQLPRSNKDLVLVASLIDKATNLGGMCRTCEIFGVKELVVNCLRVTEDRLFKDLAMTADKWLNIKEVPSRSLKTYLTEMKANGYTLVGIEQTTNSAQLNKFDFPTRSVLVLGSEKEGIPIEIIQLLDVCLEIPQLGMIRSLNVHVSAAIAVWEYTKQQLA